MPGAEATHLGDRSRPVRSAVGLLRNTYENFRADRAIRLGAGLAYYAVFALVPLATTALAIAGLLFSSSEIREFIGDQLGPVASAEMVAAVEQLAVAVDLPAAVGSLTVFGLAAAVFASSLLFVALQDTFNVIWDIPVERGLRHSIRRRLLAFAVVVTFGGLLASALIAQSVAVFLDELFFSAAGVTDALDELIVTLASWVLGVAALAVLFQLLTRPHLPWRHVFTASGVTAVMLVVGTWALGLYFRYWQPTSLTGVAGSVLVVLVWLYYSAQILVGGAELLRALASQDEPRGPQPVVTRGG